MHVAFEITHRHSISSSGPRLNQVTVDPHMSNLLQGICCNHLFLHWWDSSSVYHLLSLPWTKESLIYARAVRALLQLASPRLRKMSCSNTLLQKQNQRMRQQSPRG